MIPSTVTNIEISICEGESYMGFEEAGQHELVLTTLNGCDSIVSIDLTILPTSMTSLIEEICEGDTFMGYSESGIYQDVYSNIVGCDSIVNIDLTVLDSDDSQCIGTSSIDIESHSVGIYPNPTIGELNIKIEDNSLTIPGSFIIYSKDGKQVSFNEEFQVEKIDVSELISGVYFLNFRLNNDKEYWFRFIKI